MRGRGRLVAAGVMAILVAAGVTPATHEPSLSWKDRLGLTTDALAEWIGAHRPGLVADVETEAEALRHADLGNGPEVGARAASFRDWTLEVMDGLGTELAPSLPAKTLLARTWRMQDEAVSEGTCGGDPPNVGSSVALNDAVSHLYEALDLDDGSLSYLNANHTLLPSSLMGALTWAVECWATAVELHASAWGLVEPSERLWLREHAFNLTGFTEHPGGASPELEGEVLQALTIVDEVQVGLLSQAATKATDAAQRLAAAFPDGCTFGHQLLNETLGPDKGGLIRIGGTGPNTYTTDVPFHVDCGGADTYLNYPAGADSETTARLAVALDLGRADDLYQPPDPGTPLLASAVGGMAVFVEQGGADRYLVGRYIGVVAVGGVSAFLDLGGSDVYQASVLGEEPFNNHQNKGSFASVQPVGGATLFLEAAGDDHYQARGADNFGHAVFGAALFLDAGGSDLYELLPGKVQEAVNQQNSTVTWRHVAGPGFGLGEYAAVAIHLDTDGDDQRSCQVELNYGCGGSGFGGALGVLLDTAGNDAFTLADHGAFRADFLHGLGAAQTAGAGLYVDLLGDDTYLAVDSGQGFGACAGTGVLVDAAGTDTYELAAGLGQGAGGGICPAVELRVGGLGFLADGLGADVFRNPDEAFLCFATPGSTAWDRVVTTGSIPGLGFGLDAGAAAEPACT